MRRKTGEKIARRCKISKKQGVEWKIMDADDDDDDEEEDK